MLLFCNMAVMTLPDRQLWGFMQGSQSLKHPESHCLSFNDGHDNIIIKMVRDGHNTGCMSGQLLHFGMLHS